MDEYNEVMLGSKAPSLQTTTSSTTTKSSTSSSSLFIFISDDEIKKMKVDLLKKELKKRGLSVHEKKAKLQQQLLDAMRDKVNVVAESTNIMVLDPNNFPAGAYWKTLQPTGEVEDPTQDNFYGPTDDPETRHLNPKKRNTSSLLAKVHSEENSF